MSRMRLRIAERLKSAQNTAAMLTTFQETDMSKLMALRSAHKEEFEKIHGVKVLTQATLTSCMRGNLALPTARSIRKVSQFICRIPQQCKCSTGRDDLTT